MCISTTCPNNKAGVGADFICSCQPEKDEDEKFIIEVLRFVVYRAIASGASTWICTHCNESVYHLPKLQKIVHKPHCIIPPVVDMLKELTGEDIKTDHG